MDGQRDVKAIANSVYAFLLVTDFRGRRCDRATDIDVEAKKLRCPERGQGAL